MSSSRVDVTSKPAGQELSKEKSPVTQTWSDLGRAEQEVVRRAEKQGGYPLAK